MKQKLIEQLNTKNQRLSEINFQLMKINLAIKTWWSSIKARASNSRNRKRTGSPNSNDAPFKTRPIKRTSTTIY